MFGFNAVAGRLSAALGPLIFGIAMAVLAAIPGRCACCSCRWPPAPGCWPPPT